MRKRGPQWSTVTIALAVIAALAIAVPALGVSSSIKKAISKEVTKQLSGKTGPSGAAGAAGAAGGQGAAGPQGPGAIALKYSASEATGALTTIATIGSVVIKASCSDPGDGFTHAQLFVRSNGAPISVNGLRNHVNEADVSSSSSLGAGLPADTDSGISFPVADGTGFMFERNDDALTLERSDRSIALNVSTLALFAGGAGDCRVSGVATPTG